MSGTHTTTNIEPVKSVSSVGVIYAITFLVLIASVVTGLYQARQESYKRDRDWSKFSQEHACKVVAKREPSGLSIVGQTGFACEDGITYWIDNKKAGSILEK